MTEKLDKVIENQELFSKIDKLLIAVSGGIDSMVLCELLLKLDYTFIIAHCNFNLRGKDSADDEMFIREWAKTNQTQVFIKSFHLDKDMNTQLQARELRYAFLRDIKRQEECKYILTAHHQNDQIETFFLNLARGAGLKGLRGMKIKSDDIIRPFIHTPKAEIIDYANFFNIKHRVDHSNSESYYLRNFIRNDILPLLNNRFRSFNAMTVRTMNQIQESQELIDEFYFDWKKTNVILDHEVIKLNKPQPSKFYFLSLFLIELGFHPETIHNIKLNINNTGKLFQDKNQNQLLIEREFLVVRSASKHKISLHSEFLLINEGEGFLQLNEGTLSWNYISGNSTALKLPETKFEAIFESKELQFPLQLRHWQFGDEIKPLGLNGKTKKIQDVFTNSKISRFDKSSIYILFSNDEALWIPGIMRSDIAKIHDQSCNYYHFKWKSTD